ncbi:transglycosylase domain-containing protein [Streptacidiphilus monticola]
MKPAREGCITADKYGEQFFCDYVEHVIERDPVFGKTAEERAALWARGGLQIHTTLDPKVQKAVYKSTHKHVYPGDKAATAMTIVQPGTGKILGMGESRIYGTSPAAQYTTLNYNVDRLMGGASGFQTGSTFKPITAAAALEAGYGMDTVLPSPYKETYPAMTDCSGSRLDTGDTVQNDSTSLKGPYAMPKALAQSVNTYFVELSAKAGLCNVVHMMNKLGITTQASQYTVGKGKLDPIQAVQSLTLGTNNLTPLEMANVYATFAARGTYCTPIALTSVTTADRKKLDIPQANCQQVMSTNTADSITSMLKGVVEDGTGAPAGFTDGRPSAGKTGTTEGHAQVWFVGYTPSSPERPWSATP